MSVDRVTTARGDWTPPDDDTLRTVLAQTRSIAVVGASGKPNRPSHGVAAYLQGVGYEIWPVNPRETEILALPVSASLADLPVPPDLVDVFRRNEDLPEVARHAVAAGARVLWIQLGLHSDEAVRIAHEAGLTVVTDRCLKVEHARLMR